MHAWCVINVVLLVGVVSAYRGADNRLVAGFEENRHYYDRRPEDTEYHYPDGQPNHISRVVHGGGHSVATPWHHQPPFSGHVNHIKRRPPPPSISTTILHRSAQWGTARIPYRGAVVNVHPSSSRQKTYRGIVTATVTSPDTAHASLNLPATKYDDIGRKAVQDQPAVVTHEPCYRCPADRAIVASKGTTRVLMEKPILKPCHYRSWSPDVKLELLSGAKYGSPLHEGTNVILSRIMFRHTLLQTCQFHYTVIVHRCPALVLPSHLIANCTASNTWGSKCHLLCPHGYQPLGPTLTECSDYPRWSEPLPHCIPVTGCSAPMSPEHGRLSCTTEDNELYDLITEGTTCQYECNAGYRIPEEQKSLAMIECISGEWNSTVDPSCQEASFEPPKRHRHRKHRHRNDPCRPNPCTKGDHCVPGPHPALALCTCQAELSKPGQICHNVVLVERLIPGKDARERKKNKATMMIGQVYGKTSAGSEIGD